MNFLAHLLLGPHEAPQAVGSLLGDFVKGPMDSIALPEGVREGIWLHRQIDGFTDRHELVARSKERVSRQRRRYAGIMVDMFYDHLLARHWQRFSGQPLDEFPSRCIRPSGRRKRCCRSVPGLFYCAWQKRTGWAAMPSWATCIRH